MYFIFLRLKKVVTICLEGSSTSFQLAINLCETVRVWASFVNYVPHGVMTFRRLLLGSVLRNLGVSKTVVFLFKSMHSYFFFYYIYMYMLMRSLNKFIIKQPIKCYFKSYSFHLSRPYSVFWTPTFQILAKSLTTNHCVVCK